MAPVFDNDEQNQMVETPPKLAKGYDANSWLFYAMRSASYAMRSAVLAPLSFRSS
jgi:hypothetical protein